MDVAGTVIIASREDSSHWVTCLNLWLGVAVTGGWRCPVGGRGRWWRSTIPGVSGGAAVVSPSSSPVVRASGAGCHEGEHSGNNLKEGEESREQSSEASNLTELFMLLVSSKPQQ